MLFFLIPVTLLYGILSRVSINLWPWFETGRAVVYDKHLYIVIIAAILVASAVILRKKESSPQRATCFFLPEIFIISAIYFFCPNLVAFGPFKEVSTTTQNEFLLVFIYAAGVVSLALIYVLACYGKKFFCGMQTTTRVFMVCVISLCFLSGSYAFQAHS